MKTKAVLAVLAEWGLAVFAELYWWLGGSALSALFLLFGYIGWIPPSKFYLWLVPVGFGISMYLAWYRQRDEKLQIRHELEQSKRSSPQFHSEWKELRAQFAQLPKHTEAQLQTDRMHGQITSEEWRVSGYAESKHTCEALCRYAGTLLLKSPHISSKLSVRIRNEQNPAWRWFFFLKESCNAADIKDTNASLTNEQGYSFKSEVIREIPVVSARACIDCASLKL